jgi:hypothetical protein
VVPRCSGRAPGIISFGWGKSSLSGGRFRKSAHGLELALTPEKRKKLKSSPSQQNATVDEIQRVLGKNDPEFALW